MWSYQQGLKSQNLETLETQTRSLNLQKKH